MRRDAQAVVLLTAGAALLKVCTSGTYERYVRTGMGPVLVVTAVALMTIGAVTLRQTVLGLRASVREAVQLEDGDGVAAIGSAAAAAVESAAAGSVEAGSAETGSGGTGSAPALVDAPDDPASEAVSAGDPAAADSSTALSAVPGLRGSDKGRTGGPGRTRPGWSTSDDWFTRDDWLESEGWPAALDDVGPDGVAVREESVDPFEADPPAPRRSWMLMLAALAVLLIVPNAAGAHQAARTPVVAADVAVAGDLPGDPAGGPVPLSLRAYVARAVDRDGASLRGRSIRLSGFLVVAADGRPYLARLVIGCCAADARPVEVGLLGDLPAELVPDQWLEVEGTYVALRDRDPVSQAAIPYVQVSAVRSIPVPADPYE